MTAHRLLYRLALFFGLVFGALLSAQAATLDVAGVGLEDRINLAGKPLLLNGAGVRYKAVFKVYTAGLYLGQKAASTDEVLDATGPKRLTITMLREIDSAELGKLSSRGMSDNMDGAAFSKLIPGVMRMSDIFSTHKRLKEGDTFMIDWIPGTGTVLTIKGKVEGEPFVEPAFFHALMRIWLGRLAPQGRIARKILIRAVAPARPKS